MKLEIVESMVLMAVNIVECGVNMVMMEGVGEGVEGEVMMIEL